MSKKKQKKNKKPGKKPKLLTWLTIINSIVLMLQGLTTLVDKLIELIDHHPQNVVLRQKGEQVIRLLPWLNNMLFLKSCQIDREVEMLWKFYSYYLRLCR